VRHFYDQWGKWMNRTPSNPMKKYMAAAE